jgi:paraquat-inducible protein A
LAVGAAIAFLITNVEPLMELSVAGRQSSTTIAGGAWQMWVQGEKITALLIALFAVIAPALQIGFLLAILLSVRRPPAPRWVGTLLRWPDDYRRGNVRPPPDLGFQPGKAGAK